MVVVLFWWDGSAIGYLVIMIDFLCVSVVYSVLVMYGIIGCSSRSRVSNILLSMWCVVLVLGPVSEILASSMY